MSGETKLHIVCAACRVGDIIFAGARHYDTVMQTQMKAVYGDPETNEYPKMEQGFIDNTGKFRSRAVALLICHDYGQPLLNDKQTGHLFSEDLY
jgi:hypothetical protein